MFAGAVWFAFLVCRRGFCWSISLNCQTQAMPFKGFLVSRSVRSKEVNFGIFYPLRFGCARLRIYHPQAGECASRK